MDFSEIIVAIIIGLVIFAINSVGSKKQQNSKNQPQGKPGRNFFPEESTPVQEKEEMPGIPPSATLDEIFAELRRNREEEERKAREEEDYIPRTPRNRDPQPQSRPQNLQRPQQQVEWRPKPHPVRNRPEAAEARLQQQPRAAACTPKPEEEGAPVFARTPAQTKPQPIRTNDSDDEPAIDLGEIDWRKAVIASEILNRKY